MEYNNIIPKIQYNNFLNGNDIYLYKDSYILSEFQKELNLLDKEIKQDEIYINNKLKNLTNIDNQKINMNLKTYNDNNQNPYFFQTFNNITKKYNNIPQRNKIFNNNSMTNIKKLNKRAQNSIIKSEPNLYKSQSNNNINKKILPKTNNISFYDDLSDISEIKKTDLSFGEQIINPDFNIDCFTQDNTKKFSSLNEFYNNLNNRTKNEKGITYDKKLELKKIMNDYPELIYNEIYKSFSKLQNLKKENNMLKNKIKKLNMEIKEKNDLINEFTELFKQSKIKFEKLILKNKINIKELENKNINEIEQLSSIIKKLEKENILLNKRINNLLNSLNKYKKFTKSIGEKNSREQRNKNNNINIFNESSFKNINERVNLTNKRDISNILLNSRFSAYQNNYSKELNSLFDNSIHLMDRNSQKKLYNYTFIRNRNNNIDKISLKKNNISKVGIESNVRKEKAIFRDLSSNIEKKNNIERKRENSVRIMNTINGKAYNSDLINKMLENNRVKMIMGINEI